MTKYELIKMNQELFKVLRANSIDPKEVHYLDMVEEYRLMKSKHHKTGYIVYYLSEKYGITERAIYKIVKRFSERVKL